MKYNKITAVEAIKKIGMKSNTFSYSPFSWWGWAKTPNNRTGN
ncbi:hypothetical protein MC28_E082 (plasmid) [Bacillus thuringiensis MC28]|nr:hypothetical protein MC28_E082 [Bacillus thuringiensis MC28]